MKLKIDEAGVLIEKNNKYYSWDKIAIISGYLIFGYDTDIMVIEILFDDGFLLKLDDSANHLLTNVLANKLDNFNINWYKEIHSSTEENEVIKIFSK